MHLSAVGAEITVSTVSSAPCRRKGHHVPVLFKEPVVKPVDQRLH